MTERERASDAGNAGSGELDAGAFIGREPELGDDVIPGGVQPEDERVAYTDSQRAADGEPDSGRDVDPPDRREAGQNR